MSSKEESKYWEEFIEIYKENPCLWDTKCADYKNQTKRNIAYGLLIEKLWEIDVNADMETVKKKIQSFHANLKRELYKIKQREENCKNYVPSWRYYKSLSFLVPFEVENIEQIISITDKKINATEISSSTETLQGKSADVPQISDNVASSQSSSKAPPEKKRKLSNTNIEDDDWEDDCSTLAAHLKSRMRSFDPLQKCIAQKLISDVMFLAETKQLQLTSVISNLSEK